MAVAGSRRDCGDYKEGLTMLVETYALPLGLVAIVPPADVDLNGPKK